MPTHTQIAQKSGGRVVAIYLFCALVPVTCAGENVQQAISSSESIAFYEKQVSLHPGSYPALAKLAQAYLSFAQKNYNPSYVSKARNAAEKSLSISSNYLAYYALGEIANYSHRFDLAICYADKAFKHNPRKASQVNSVKVEALIAMDQVESAGELLADHNSSDYFSCISRAQIARKQNRVAEAVEFYFTASKTAPKQAYSEATSWAVLMMAGTYLDCGYPEKAKPILEKLLRTQYDNEQVSIHWAEYLQTTGKRQEALQVYQKLTASSANPVVYERAYRLSLQLGNTQLASNYFDKAESIYQSAIDLGEIFTIESLAHLYIDAGVKPDRARELKALLQTRS
ncbi:MAG: tetratricopeptide repeat protein [Verrucomicrobiales bacterium]